MLRNQLKTNNFYQENESKFMLLKKCFHKPSSKSIHALKHIIMDG
jgi:hypothetical protein